MKNIEIDDEKLLNILLAQGLISQEQKNACLTYQQEYLRRTGEKVATPKVLQKLEILPLDKIVSIVKAIEGSQASSSEEDDDEQEEVKKDVLVSHKPRLVPAFSPKNDIRQSPEKESAKFLFEKNLRPQTPKEKEEVATIESEKSLVLSYFLVFFFGIFGAHRLYLRCYRSGILYGLTLGFFGIGLILDIVLVPFLLKSYRREKEQRKSEWQDMAKYESSALEDSVPDWSKKETGLQKITNAFHVLLQWIYLLVAPLLLALISIIFWQAAMPFIVLLWITLFLASHSLKDHLAQRSLWRHVPFLEFLHQRLLQAEGFYFQNEPKSLLLYLLYPIWMPFMILFRPKRREELYCYLWIILASMGLIFSGMVYLASLFSFEYSNILQNLLITQGIVWFFSLILFLAVCVPYFTSLMSFKVKKNNFATKVFAGWGWLISFILLIFLLFGSYVLPWKTYSHQDAIRSMISKLQSDQYKKTFQALLKALPEGSSNATQGFSEESAKEYTKTLRLFVRGIASCKEAQALMVTYLKESQKMLVHLEQYPLAVLSDRNSIEYSWIRLDGSAKKEIEQVLKSCIVCPYIEEYRKKMDIPVGEKMLND